MDKNELKERFIKLLEELDKQNFDMIIDYEDVYFFKEYSLEGFSEEEIEILKKIKYGSGNLYVGNYQYEKDFEDSVVIEIDLSDILEILNGRKHDWLSDAIKKVNLFFEKEEE